MKATMNMSKKPTIIEMERMDESIISPAAFLALSESDRRDIDKISPVVKDLGSCGMGDTSFVAFRVRWKTPRYRVNL